MNNRKKNSFLNKGLILSFLFLSFSFYSFSQEITEKRYLELDKQLWEQYEADMEKLHKEFKKNPDKRDSLGKVVDEIYNKVLKEN